MTTSTDIKPFKVSIPDSELELLRQKLLLTRLPMSLSDASWMPDSNYVTIELLESVHKTWLSTYSWKDVEDKLNLLPQYITKVPMDGFGSLEIQFFHSPSTATLSAKKSVPLLYLHGWPGSVIEITKALPLFNEKGFDVVAPSLPGWLSSTLPKQKGFKIHHHAEVVHKLMLKLGYEKYIIQGGDWGGSIAPELAVMHPECVLGMHVNYFPTYPEPQFASKKEQEAEETKFSAFEQNSLARFRNFKEIGTGYVQIQHSKPLTLSVGLHDSPIGLVAWIADKVLDWSDSFPRNPRGYKWSNEELITWTLIQYFGDAGPAGPFQMYVENSFEEKDGGNKRKYVSVPTGVSALKWENEMVPRRWVEIEAKVVWWREHERGGHFALYEMPEELVTDVNDFVNLLGLREEI